MEASILLAAPSQAAAVAAVLLSFNLHAAEPPSPPPRSRSVQELTREARAAVDRLDVERARVLWAQIYELEHSTMALCQLGQLDGRVGRFDEAAEKLSMCVEQMPPPSNPMERSRYEGRHADLAAARQHVGELHVLPPSGAVRTLVDGKEVDARRPAFVKPGQHEITAFGPQEQVARARVTIAPGESQSVPLTFEIQPAAARVKAPAAPPVPPPPTTRSGPKLWIIGTGATAAVALVATGVGLHLTGIGLDGDAEATQDRIKDAFQNGSITKRSSHYPPLYEDATATKARANTMHNLGSAALLAGGVLGAATVVYVVLPRDAAKIQARANGVEVTFTW